MIDLRTEKNAMVGGGGGCGTFMSTMKHDMPLCLSDLSVVAKTTPYLCHREEDEDGDEG